MTTTDLATSNGGALATREQLPIAQDPPSAASILLAGVERGMDPTSLRELAALYERMQDREARQAFNRAMDAFKGACPAILKVRQAKINSNKGNYSYNYAPLEEITKVVDPVLHKNGLSYRWDGKLMDGLTTITCTVCHVDGHRESSTFVCRGCGSPSMSPAQQDASAVTLAKRHSLVMALGITTDEDDDGRRGEPNPAPDADPAAPRVLPRDERAATQQNDPDGIDQTPRVTASDLNGMLKAYKAKWPDASISFTAWARDIIKTDSPLTAVGMWNVEWRDMVAEALRREE